MSLAMIGKLLGHTQVQTTARYAHLMADPVREAAGKVAQGIASAVAGVTKQEQTEHVYEDIRLARCVMMPI